VIIETSIDIDAPLDRVWAALIDFARYPEWNPLTERVLGEPRVDEVVTLHVHLAGRQMTRKHVISRADGQALCWTIRTRKPWLMRGERCQALTDLGDGRCRYANREEVLGLVSPIVEIGFGKAVRAGLEAVGQALKVHVEEGRSP